MIRRVIFAVAAISVAATSLAQETKPVGLSVRAGIFFPTNSLGRGEGNSWFGGGVDYKLGNASVGGMSTGTTTHYGLSVDFFGKGDVSAVPVLATIVSHTNEFYWTAGAGIAFTRDFTVVGNVRNKRNKANFAYMAGAGYEFQKGSTPLFVEGRFFGNSNSNVNGFGVYLGVRL